MEKIILVLLMVIPFGLFSKADVIEPKLHCDIIFEYTIPNDFVEHNSKVFVRADDGVSGLELWAFNRDINSMQMVKDINPDGDSNPIIVSNELDHQLLFVAKDENGTGLWATDGTEEGTILLKYIVFTDADWNGVIDVDARLFKKYNNEVYFGAVEPKTFEFGLWKTDGTPDGTVRVFKYEDLYLPYISRFSVSNDRLQFQLAHDSHEKNEIWVTEGDSISTKKLSPNYFEASFDGSNANHLFFIDYSENSHSLWVTDGTEKGTINLIPNKPETEFVTESYVLIDYFLLFTLIQNNKTREVWISDGTLKGTYLLAEVSNDQESKVNYIKPQKIDHQQAFFVVNEKEGSSLWTSGGTVKNTLKLTEPNVEINSWGPGGNGYKLFFVASDDAHGEELWVTDGTEIGTHLIKDIEEGAHGSGIRFFSDIIKGKVLFLTESATGENSGWVSDGTEVGTNLLHKGLLDLYTVPRTTKQINNNTLFVERSTSDTTRIWYSDLTTRGTQLVMPLDFQTPSPTIEPLFHQELEGNVYFFADYYGEGEQLYRIPNTISSVEDTPQPGLMTVYPNPAKDFIQLELTKPMQLSIINSTGAMVKEYGIVDNGKLNVTELISGVYFVVDEQGNNIAKFVKE